jgi:hypothetical protein
VNDSFSVDADRMRDAGDNISQSSQAMSGSVSQFEAQLASYGDAFGGDDLGSLIGMVYGVIHDLAMDCFETNIADTQEAGETVTAMANNFSNTEDNTTASFDAFDRGM